MWQLGHSFCKSQLKLNTEKFHWKMIKCSQVEQWPKRLNQLNVNRTFGTHACTHAHIHACTNALLSPHIHKQINTAPTTTKATNIPTAPHTHPLTAQHYLHTQTISIATHTNSHTRTHTPSARVTITHEYHRHDFILHLWPCIQRRPEAAWVSLIHCQNSARRNGQLHRRTRHQ